MSSPVTDCSSEFPQVLNDFATSPDTVSFSGPSSVVSSSDPGPSSLPLSASVRLSASDVVSIFYENIARSRGVGLCCSCFSVDIDVVVALACLHGVDVEQGCSLEEARFRVLRHLLVGDCIRSSEYNSSLPAGSRHDIVCGQLSSPFPSATDMSVAFL